MSSHHHEWQHLGCCGATDPRGEHDFLCLRCGRQRRGWRGAKKIHWHGNSRPATIESRNAVRADGGTLDCAD